MEASEVGAAETSPSQVRTLFVSALAGQFELPAVPESETIGQLKQRICSTKGYHRVRLLLQSEGGGESLPDSDCVASLKPDAELLCVALPPALVLECGTTTCRAGFAGEDVPRALFPTVVGSPRQHGAAVDGDGEVSVVGLGAISRQSTLQLRYPVHDDVITSWEDMEKVWRHIFASELRVEPGAHPVVLVEAPLNPKANRERTAQVMFETLGVPRLYLAVAAVLSLFASGRATGVVLDVGERSRHTVPVYEGYALPHAIVKYARAGGAELTDALVQMLGLRGYALGSSRDREIARHIKETRCYVALDYDAELELARGVGTDRTYELPNGTCIDLGSELFQVPEALFAPYRFYRGDYYRSGLHEDVYNATMRTDVDIRNHMYANVVLAGGTCLLPGIVERLSKELEALAPRCCVIRIVAATAGSTWLGGSHLASAPGFEEVCLSKAEYDDVGPTAIHRL